jgi:hypothetical protein
VCASMPEGWPSCALLLHVHLFSLFAWACWLLPGCPFLHSHVLTCISTHNGDRLDLFVVARHLHMWGLTTQHLRLHAVTASSQVLPAKPRHLRVQVWLWWCLLGGLAVCRCASAGAPPGLFLHVLWWCR